MRAICFPGRRTRNTVCSRVVLCNRWVCSARQPGDVAYLQVLFVWGDPASGSISAGPTNRPARCAVDPLSPRARPMAGDFPRALRAGVVPVGGASGKPGGQAEPSSCAPHYPVRTLTAPGARRYVGKPTNAGRSAVLRCCVAVAAWIVLSGSAARAEIAINMAMINGGSLQIFGRISPARKEKIALDESTPPRRTPRAASPSSFLTIRRAASRGSRPAGRRATWSWVTARRASPSGSPRPSRSPPGFCRPRICPSPRLVRAVRRASRVPRGRRVRRGRAARGVRSARPARAGRQDRAARRASRGRPDHPGPTASAAPSDPRVPAGAPAPAGIALRVQVEACSSGGRCVASCRDDEFAVNGTCSGGERPAMDETSIYCFGMGRAPAALRARAICARQ